MAVRATSRVLLHGRGACNNDDAYNNDDAFSTCGVVAALAEQAFQWKAPVLQLCLNQSPLQTVH